VLAGQRAALGPLVAESAGTFKKAAENTLAHIAGGLLSDAEAAAKRVGLLQLLRGGLPQHLHQVRRQWPPRRS
jgi:hypothetical protein